MAPLAVLGNISLDHATTRHGQRRTSVGGAALHIALAATAGALQAAPVAVTGHDLRWLPADPRLAILDWSAVSVRDGQSAAFTLTYDTDDTLVGLRAEHGVASGLTSHVLQRIHTGRDDTYHVCCRTPLNTGRVLSVLADRHATFSADFIISSAATAIPAAAPFLPQARVVFVNQAEYHLLASAVPIEDLPAVVVSDGPRTARLYRHGQLAAAADPPPVPATQISGAGDTLAGAFLAALAVGHEDQAALQRAVAKASAHTTTPPIHA